MRFDTLQRRLVTILLVLGIAVLALWLFEQMAELFARVADVVLVFVFAWALAYLLMPPVAWLQGHTRLSRLGAVAVVYICFVVVLVALLSLVIPTVATQIAGLVERAPEYGERFSASVRGVQLELAQRGIPLDVAGVYAALPGRAAATAADAVLVLGGVVATLVEASLVFIVAFFMLLNGDRLWREFVALLPAELASEAELLRISADRSFGGFLRAQLLLGLAYGVITWLMLFVIGVPFAALLGLVSGVFMVIPFFGAIVALFPPLLVALPQSLQLAIATLVLLAALQFVMLNVVSPRLLAHTVGIHPLFVFLALLLGARIAGFWGVFLALPIAGVLNAFARYVFQVALGRRVRTEAHLINTEETAS